MFVPHVFETYLRRPHFWFLVSDVDVLNLLCTLFFVIIFLFSRGMLCFFHHPRVIGACPATMDCFELWRGVIARTTTEVIRMYAYEMFYDKVHANILMLLA